MTNDEINALLAECDNLEQCYAEAAAFGAAHTEQCQQEDEDYECFDPVRDGWVGKDGLP